MTHIDGLDHRSGRGNLESKSEAFGHCKSYALRATLLHSSHRTTGRNNDQDQDPIPLDGAAQVFPRLRLQCPAKLGGAVEGWAREKPLQQVAPLAPKRFLGHPGVLLGNLPLVLVETPRRRPQDGKVDIDEQALVGRDWNGRMSGGQHQPRHPLRLQAGNPGLPQGGLGPGRTARLVIRRLGVVNRVVKPQRHLHLPRPLCQVAPRLQGGETLGERSLGMVVALGISVARKQQSEQLAAPILGAQRVPGTLPGAV